jgi:YidC/Oxa1 family membrane protein insertase
VTDISPTPTCDAPFEPTVCDVQPQALQPQIKSLQKQYAYDKERLQMETARLYQENNVNPLAGCLPTLATLPVWIGLYRALSNVANEGLLEDGFFWIPSLAGPSALASGGKEGGGMSWLLPLTDGAPPVGWHDAGAYLVLPVLLVASQYVSQAIISPPKTDDSSAEQANAILKFLPLMIGWFSLNVPSGLTLYWFTNNLLTTGQQVYLRKSTAAPAAAGAAGVAPSAAVLDAEVISTGGDSASAAAVEGESRKERRERERAEKRGARFAERKAKEALSKEE